MRGAGKRAGDGGRCSGPRCRGQWRGDGDEGGDGDGAVPVLGRGSAGALRARPLGSEGPLPELLGDPTLFSYRLFSEVRAKERSLSDLAFLLHCRSGLMLVAQ